MQEHNTFSSKLPGLIDSVGRNVKELALRIVVHGVALLSGFLLANVTGAEGNSYPVAVLASYTGLVCLFAREMSLKAAWLFPFLAGCAQLAACLVLGEPLAVGLFWAGAQAWTQRFVWKQGAMGVEWGMLILLIPGVITILGGGHAVLGTVAAFLGIGAAAWVIRSNFLRSPLLPAHVKNLRQDRADLQVVINTGRMAKPLEAGAREFAALLDAYTGGGQALLPREAGLLVREAGDTTSRLMQYVERSQPQAWDAEAQKILSALSGLCGALRRTMPKAPGADVQGAAKTSADAAALAAYQSSIAELTAKKVNLPLDLYPCVDGIVKGAENILECMRTDERDVRPGTNFLDRYLPAVHKVVDEHTRLSRENVITRELADALAQSKDTLARLQEAFAKEHTSLLQNDVTDFSVELGVLDKLLKMDGR